MSGQLADDRFRRVGWTIAIAGLFTLIAVLVAALNERRVAPAAAGGPVIPGFAQSVADANLIVIQTKNAIYRIARTRQGWALRDKGDYPVRREALAQFTTGLASLTYGRAMTRDPGKLDRLGLGDPEKGGDGVLVQVQNTQGALIANLVLGIEPRGAYVRIPGKDQSWAIEGDLPPLKDPAAWLDLAPIALDKTRIARVDVTPEQGPPFSVVRADAAARDFALGAPFDRFLVTTPVGLNGVGEAFAVLAPIDVAGAPSIGGPVRARATMRTFDGLVIEGELYGDQRRHWLKFVARGETSDAIEEARAINARAAPWAYGLSQLDYQKLAPPLSLIARSPAPAPLP